MATPVILDTDIGTDIDDTWALAMLPRSPELDLRLGLTETAGRPDVPVGIGLRFDPGGEYQAPWVEGYRLDAYPGVVQEDGVAALIEIVRSSNEPVTIIASGPCRT